MTSIHDIDASLYTIRLLFGVIIRFQFHLANGCC